MRKSADGLIFWAPRALGVLFALFLSLFALDVFTPGISFWKALTALLIHLVPVYVALIALAIAWRWEWVGAILFFSLAVFYLVWTWGRVHWSAKLGISGPLALIGLLFLLGWVRRSRLHGHRAP